MTSPAAMVYIDPYSADILSETTVDYVKSLQREGFVFNEPGAPTPLAGVDRRLVRRDIMAYSKKVLDHFENPPECGVFG